VSTNSSAVLSTGGDGSGYRDGHTSPHLRTPPRRHLTPSDPLSASLGQVLALGDQTHSARANHLRATLCSRPVLTRPVRALPHQRWIQGDHGTPDPAQPTRGLGARV